VNEESDMDVVHFVGLGERGGLPRESSDVLAQGAVESLDVVGLASHGALGELFRGHHLSVGTPDVAEAVGSLVSRGQAVPQQAARLDAMTTQSKSHDLARAPTKSQPQPHLVLSLSHKRPHLIQLQHLAFFNGKQRLLQRRQSRHFF